MTQTNFEKVLAFHKAFNINVGALPHIPAKSMNKLRMSLVLEELEEFIEAKATSNLSQMTKELCDLIYVLYGYGATLGVDLDHAFNLVHESNMSKLDDLGNPLYREDGKVLKSKNYKPVDDEEIVRRIK